jgi:hypothetical protein
MENINKKFKLWKTMFIEDHGGNWNEISFTDVVCWVNKMMFCDKLQIIIDDVIRVNTIKCFYYYLRKSCPISFSLSDCDKEMVKDYPKININKFYEEQSSRYPHTNDIIANWMEDCVEESDDVTPFDELFFAWERWCDEEGYTNKQRPEKKEIKEYLKKAQEKTLAGPGIYGKKAAEVARNGTKNKPKFNFTVIDD